MRSNIPTCDFTTKSETKEESKQTEGAVDPRIAQPTKRLASNSLRANASDEKSPTIVTPVITAPVERRLDGNEDHEAQQSPSATGPMVEDPRIRSPAAASKDGGSTTEKAARLG